MEINYCNRKEENLCTNKVGSKVRIVIVKNMKIAEVTSKNVRNIFFVLRSEV